MSFLNKYSLINFILDLKKALIPYAPKGFIAKGGREKGMVSDEGLSKLLGQDLKRIRLDRINFNKNTKYNLSLERLESYYQGLKKNIGIKADEFRIYFDKYFNDNKIPKFQSRIYKFHPNIILDYFKTIDIKEKAYWFGWLFAEANLYRRKEDQQIEFSVTVNVKDGIIIKRFIESIGFNPKYVKYRKRTKYNEKGEPYVSRTFRIKFKSKVFASNLINKGMFIGKKAGKIRLISLKSREFYLAFLLGFFDGDGSVYLEDSGDISANIYSKSKLFLEDIKIQFQLPYKIVKAKRLLKNGTEVIYYSIALGMELYNELMVNFQDSLPRKRIISKVTYNYPIKFLFSKEKLNMLLINHSLEEIAGFHKKKYGIEINKTTVAYWRDKWRLESRDRKKFHFSKEDLAILMKQYNIQEIVKLHKEKTGININPLTVYYWRDKWGLEPIYHWNKKE